MRVDPVGKIDEKSWIESARTYERLRRRCLRFTLGYVGPVVILAILLGVVGRSGSERLYSVLVFLFLILVPTTCACGIGTCLTSFDLWNFRCPRCGRRFASAWWGSWPTTRCKHCRLDLGLATKATGESRTVVDPLE
jgi:hypothetical protein